MIIITLIVATLVGGVFVGVAVVADRAPGPDRPDAVAFWERLVREPVPCGCARPAR
jgi:hypothetical protein